MTATLINGKEIAEKIKEDIKNDVQSFSKKTGIIPKLVVILVGNNPASNVYVRNKKKACEKVGIHSEIIEKEENLKEEELIQIIENLNRDTSVHGILVQLPLPEQIDDKKIIPLIHPEKDVDAFHPINVGNLLIGESIFQPCTPSGIIELLKHCQIPTSGKNVVILGRSNIVGKPLLALLLKKGEYGDATVTICHSRTQFLKNHTLSADILIAAIGKPQFVRGDMVKEGSVVIDVGMNRIPDLTHPKGSRLVGDVHFEEVREKASLITPVPGGVGPMTITMLLQNTLKAAKCHANP